ncbi:MAG TPA: hypothetical protein VIV57_13435 [Anaeromyxobacter sp.]
MLLADLLLTVALGQACPQPLSAGDPPPCAAANVAGCLPGYTPVRDRYGKLIYVCSAPRPAAAPAAVPAYAPAAPAYASPPPAYAPPAPAYAPPPALAYPAPRERGRGRLALVFMPGRTTDPAVGTRGGRELDRNAAAAALELRGRDGGARLRVQAQYTELGRVAELGLKYDFFDRSPIRPFIGLAAGASLLDPDTRWRASGSAFAGFDVFLDRNAFLTAEIQGRRFANRTSDASGRGLDLSDRRQTTVLVGIGMYL